MTEPEPPANTTTPAPEPAGGRRSKRRRNVIRNSPNRGEYELLIDEGWSSIGLSRYALYRYGEDIPDRTFRAYRAKLGKSMKDRPDTMRHPLHVDLDTLPDVVRERMGIYLLQKQRVIEESQREENRGTMARDLRVEIRFMAEMLDQVKQDMQDLGLFPKTGQRLEIAGQVLHPRYSQPQVDDGRNRYTPAATSLGQLLGAGSTQAQELELARVLHQMMPAVERPVLAEAVVESDDEQRGA